MAGTTAERAIPRVRYAKSQDVHIAYQVVGDGPPDLVFFLGCLTHGEALWRLASMKAFLDRLASFSRMIRASPMINRCGNGGRPSIAAQRVRLKDSKGLQYLAHLLARPGQEIAALDPTQQPGRSAPGADENPAVDNGGLAALDAQAKQEYRQRWRELQQDLAEAEEHNDLGRAGKLKAELDFLTQQLNAAVDLYGKDRKAGAAAERARLMVTKRIKSVLKLLDTLHPPLPTTCVPA